MFSFSKKSTTTGVPNSCTPAVINSLDLRGIIDTTALLATRLRALAPATAPPYGGSPPPPGGGPPPGGNGGILLEKLIKRGTDLLKTAEEITPKSEELGNAISNLKILLSGRKPGAPINIDILNVAIIRVGKAMASAGAEASEGDISAARALLGKEPKYTIPDDINSDTNVADAKVPFIAAMRNLEGILPGDGAAASAIPIPTKAALADAVAKFKAAQANFFKAVATATLEEGQRKVTGGDTSARLAGAITALEASITTYSAANAATRTTDDMETKTANLIRAMNPDASTAGGRGGGAGAGMSGGARRRRTNKNRRRYPRRQTRSHH
jgi:hypothetical protein